MCTLQLTTFGRSWPSQTGPSVHAFAKLYFICHLFKVTVGYTSLRILLQPCIESVVFPVVHVVNPTEGNFLGRIMDGLTNTSSDHLQGEMQKTSIQEHALSLSFQTM